jgi:putative hydrolase of the HAD superfamily
MISVVAFDLDDTLYLERDFVRSGFAAVGGWLATERGVRGFEACAWRLFETGRRGDIFDCVLQHLGIAPERALLQRLVRVYREHLPTIRLDPAAADLLARLTGRCHLAVLTDGFHQTQQLKILALGLGSRCRPIVCTDRWGRDHWKPCPRGFEHIQQSLGAPPERCIYIGDNPAKDFRAPKALGWRTLRVRHPLGEHASAVAASPLDEADTTVTSLGELSVNDLLIQVLPKHARSGQGAAHCLGAETAHGRPSGAASENLG